MLKCVCSTDMRDHSGYGFSQWKTTLHCSISHWLGPYPEWSLWLLKRKMFYITCLKYTIWFRHNTVNFSKICAIDAAFFALMSKQWGVLLILVIPFWVFLWTAGITSVFFWFKFMICVLPFEIAVWCSVLCQLVKRKTVVMPLLVHWG